MLMLIPLALIAALSVTFFLMVMSDDIDTRVAQIESSARSISFHHEALLKMPVTATGPLAPPAGGVFTAFGGLRSYAHIEGGTTFILTWPQQFDIGSDPDAGFAIGEIQASMSKSLTRLENAFTPIGDSFFGAMEPMAGPFGASVGPIVLPFTPPVSEGAPVLLTIISGV